MKDSINDCIFEIIPIIILFLFAYYSNEIEEISNTVLGKLLAITIIIYYTNENLLYGLIGCLLIIVYYQTKDIESMHNRLIWSMNNIVNDTKNIDIQPDPDITFHEKQIQNNVPTNYYSEIHKLNESIAKQIETYSENDLKPHNINNSKNTSEYIIQQINKILHLHTPPIYDNNYTNHTKLNNDNYLQMSKEPFETNPHIFTNYNYSDLTTNNKDDLKQIFKSQYCKNGILTYKNIGVKNEMTPHIFNEIEFNDEKSPCNICSDKCLFKIDPKKPNMNTERMTDKKLKTEKHLFWDMFQ